MWWCKLILCVFLLITPICAENQQTWDKDFWRESNKKELEKALKETNTNVAKNLVLAIGDGMGVTTTTAIRVYRGQKTPGLLGEEALLSWDKFPHTGMSKTYTTDVMTADSGASATAYHCGVKTKQEMIGVDDSATRLDCSSVEAARVKSLLDLALEEGKSVGIVTTDAVVGASPSGAYAHSAHRTWRGDFELPEEAKGVCKDIARQLVEDNLDIQVALGGGRKYFLPTDFADPEYLDVSGKREDGMNLVEEWLKAQQAKGRNAAYVTDQKGFDSIDDETTDYLLGLFEPDKLQDEVVRVVNKTEPSLAQMTEKAIKILRRNPKGYFLFIEGANIDIGHHENRARKALEEGLAFDDAVTKVMDVTSSDDTLVVVSADHGSTLAYGGNAGRGHDLLSVADNPGYPFYNLDKFGNPYTLLSYGNGPGFVKVEDRVDLKANPDYYAEDRPYLSANGLWYGTHGGEDVQIFASGPMSHLFTGTHEQTYIPDAMAYAACIGENGDHCQKSMAYSSGRVQGASIVLLFSILLVIQF